MAGETQRPESPTCQPARHATVAYRAETWHWQHRAGQPTTRADGAHLSRSCRYVRWARDLWWQRKTEARDSFYRLPLTHDWRTSVRVVQRVYPGTDDWMLAISRREGGYGPWVWYGGRRWQGYHVGNDFLGADTVGGWMQFRFSTFAPYWRGAVKDLRRRGFRIPELGSGYGPWLEPLGQALTAGYMRYYGKDGCHWCLG